MKTNENMKQFSLKELLYPGSFVIGNKLYFVGGQRINSKGFPKSNKKVFSLELKKLTPMLENVRFGIKVIRPLCASGSSNAIIAGGTNPKLTKPSPYCYVFHAEPQPEFKLLETIGFSLQEHYPPMYIASKGPLFISFPKVAYKDKHIPKWSHTDLAKKIEGENAQDGQRYEIVEIKPAGEAKQTYKNFIVEYAATPKDKKVPKDKKTKKVEEETKGEKVEPKVPKN